MILIGSCFALAFLSLHKTFITIRGRSYTDTPFVIPPGVLKPSQQIGDDPNLCTAIDLYNKGFCPLLYTHTYIYVIYICVYIYYMYIYISYTYVYIYIYTHIHPYCTCCSRIRVPGGADRALGGACRKSAGSGVPGTSRDQYRNIRGINMGISMLNGN